MEEIVYEVVGGAIILGIILLVIGVFRTGTGTIRDSVKQQAQADNIRMEELVGVHGGTYTHSKIKEAISYADIADMPIEVWVQNGGNKRHITTWQDSDEVTYGGNHYQLHVGYYDEKDTGVPNIDDNHFTIEAKQSDKIVLIRFVYVKVS